MNAARAVSLAATLLLAAGSLGGQEPAAELPVTPNTKLYAKIERTIIGIHSVFDRLMKLEPHRHQRQRARLPRNLHLRQRQTMTISITLMNRQPTVRLFRL